MKQLRRILLLSHFKNSKEAAKAANLVGYIEANKCERVFGTMAHALRKLKEVKANE